jgi:hypothetical protein
MLKSKWRERAARFHNPTGCLGSKPRGKRSLGAPWTPGESHAAFLAEFQATRLTTKRAITKILSNA